MEKKMNRVKMTNEDIKEICYETLEFFSDYCKKNNLRFFLGYGTALGAIRHNGFIPWDDDIDVTMPRPDYEKFIYMYDNQREKYLLLTHEKDKSYYYPFAKLCDRETVLKEDHFKNDKNMGIYIDIFPLDGNGIDYETAKKHLKKCIRTQQKLNNTMLKHFLRTRHNIFVEFARYCRFRLLNIVGPDYFWNKLDKMIKKYEYDESEYISNNSWCTYATRDLFIKEIFEETVSITFEKQAFPMPKQYDKYLSSLYGDYMKLPPEENRVSHHDMVAYYKDREI